MQGNYFPDWQPVAQIDLTPENCFAPCSLRIIYPCSDSVPLSARTCHWASDRGHRPERDTGRSGHPCRFLHEYPAEGRGTQIMLEVATRKKSFRLTMKKVLWATGPWAVKILGPRFSPVPNNADYPMATRVLKPIKRNICKIQYQIQKDICCLHYRHRNPCLFLCHSK